MQSDTRVKRGPWTNRNNTAPMLGDWCEVRRKKAVSPIAVPDIVPTTAALSEAFQSLTESHSDKIRTLDYQIGAATIEKSIAH